MAKPLKAEFLDRLILIVGKDFVISDSDARKLYASDSTEDFVFMPDVVVKPDTVEEVSDIMKLCYEFDIPLTPRGAGTGLSGACLPVSGGLILSTERLNRILAIDEKNFQATVEPGVINEVFRNAVEAVGLLYPPDPASKGSCFLGGNIAHNSGGPKAVKYGVTRDYVLNLEVVLPTGEIIWTGADTLKNSTGYSLTHLMIGSEGTLGIVTKIVFRLLTKPTHDLLMLASFANAGNACAAVAEIFRTGVTPSALELMERKAVELSAFYLNETFDHKEGMEIYLLIEVDGFDPDLLMKDCEKISEALERFGVDDLLFMETFDQKEKIWKIRRAIGEKVKAHSIYKEEDTVVSRAYLPELLAGVKEIGSRYGFESICYGHAGDGNLHVNIIKGEMSDENWKGKHLEEGIREIFRLCKKLGGTISGEHGIGLVQKKYMNEVFEPMQIDLMRKIKAVFDPKGLLNPGKIFP
jgi:glycolate oxidase